MGTISLNVHVNDNAKDLAVKCDVVLKTIFEDVVTIQDVQVFNFPRVVGSNYISEECNYYNSAINPSSITSCDVILKKLVNNKEVVTVENDKYPLIEVAEYVNLLNNNQYASGVEVFEKAKELGSGAEEYDFLVGIQAPDELLGENKKIADSEKMYGIMPKSAIHKIREYYQLDNMLRESDSKESLEPVAQTKQIQEIKVAPISSPVSEPEPEQLDEV